MRYGLVLAAFAAAMQTADAAPAPDPIRVVTTLEDLREICEAIGGDRVEVEALAPGNRDPHTIVPTPGLMARVNAADLFVELGLELELWAENVLDGARNPRVRRGQPGHVWAATNVPRLDVPTEVTRREGDLHPSGNPHVNLSPLNWKIMARNIALGLIRVDPASADAYEAGLAAFEERVDRACFGDELIDIFPVERRGTWRARLDELARTGQIFSFLEDRQLQGRPLIERLGGWFGRMRALRGTRIVTYHRTWSYLVQAFGLVSVGELEPKPGIPPSAGHLGELEVRARSAGTRVVVCEPYKPFSDAEVFAASIDARAVVLPSYVGGVEGADDLFSMFDVIVERLEEAAGD